MERLLGCGTGLRGAVQPGAALREALSPQPAQVAPAKHGDLLADEASSKSSEPSVMGHSYDVSSSSSTWRFLVSAQLEGETSESSDDQARRVRLQESLQSARFHTCPILMVE